MNSVKSQYVQQALRNYSVVLLFCFIVIALSYFQGMSSELIALKVLATPIMWLAMRGPDSLFKSPVYEGEFTIRALEYSIISGFVFSVFVVLLILQPGVDIWRLVTVSAISTPFLGVGLLVAGIRRTRHDNV